MKFVIQIIIHVLALGVGLWVTFKPESAWKFAHRFTVKDAEPTELAIVLNFISGIIISIVAVISGVLLVLGQINDF